MGSSPLFSTLVSTEVRGGVIFAFHPIPHDCDISNGSVGSSFGDVILTTKSLSASGLKPTLNPNQRGTFCAEHDSRCTEGQRDKPSRRLQTRKETDGHFSEIRKPGIAQCLVGPQERSVIRNLVEFL